MKKICFRVDANSKIGQGHAMRCRAIANELKKRGILCIFAVADSDSKRFFASGNFPCRCLGLSSEDYSIEAAVHFSIFLKQNGIGTVLLDSYSINQDYIDALRPNVKVACFYCGEDKLDVDLLINYNINYNREFYLNEYANSRCKLLLGAAYVPLREEFCVCAHTGRKEEGHVQKLLFLTGGSDSLGLVNCLEKVCNRLNDCTITAVIGSYSSFLNDGKNIDLDRVNIVGQTDRLCALMKESDLVISAGGCTMYELCALGVPAIIYSMADNQTSESVYMGDLGIVKYVGDARQDGFWDKLLLAIYALKDSKTERQKMSDKMRSITDGLGAKRIADSLINL